MNRPTKEQVDAAIATVADMDPTMLSVTSVLAAEVLALREQLRHSRVVRDGLKLARIEQLLTNAETLGWLMVPRTDLQAALRGGP